MGYKLTKKKRKFALLIQSGKPGPEAARLAGYGTNPASHSVIASQLMRKNPDGTLQDTSLEKFFCEIRQSPELVETALQPKPPAPATIPEPLTLRQILGLLSGIALDEQVTTSTRVDAMKTLLKQINEDRDREEYIDRDPEELRQYAQQLLGIRVGVQ